MAMRFSRAYLLYLADREADAERERAFRLDMKNALLSMVSVAVWGTPAEKHRAFEALEQEMEQ